MSAYRALAAAILGIAFAVSAPAADKESRPGVYHGYSEARYDGWVKTSQYVKVKDGTRLAVDIFRPALKGTVAPGRFPVIWTHTPYRRSTLRPDGKLASALDSWGLIDLVKYGYVLAAVDTRGRGASFGVRRGF